MLVPALLAAAALCGPAHATTLAADAEARVYVAGQTAYSCHRDRPGASALGAAGRVRDVALAGPRALIRWAQDGGERLSLYDLRRAVRTQYRDSPTPFTAIAVNRNGLAISISNHVVASLKQRSVYADDPGVDPAFLGLAGGTIAWREHGAFRLQALLGSNAVAAPLLSAGAVRVSVTHNRLFARLGGGPPRALGTALNQCESSSGCGGIASIQIANHHLAALDTEYSAGSGTSELRIYDLARRQARRVCEPDRYGGFIDAFVLTDGGHAVCALSGTPPRILYGTTVLDSGPGIATSSLTRQGERLVWIDDGLERSAPLPG